MKYHQALQRLAVGLSSLGLVLPAPLVQAAPPAPPPAARHSSPQATVAACDVQLDETGNLCGMVVNVDGVPVADIPVEIWQTDQQVAAARTDLLGRFAVGGLKGGTYAVRVNQQSKIVRAWAPRTAPPAAKPMALVVLGGSLVRGQLPAERFFSSDAFVICGMVAAAIAIPIAVHNSRSEPSEPASP